MKHKRLLVVALPVLMLLALGLQKKAEAGGQNQSPNLLLLTMAVDVTALQKTTEDPVVAIQTMGDIAAGIAGGMQYNLLVDAATVVKVNIVADPLTSDGELKQKMLLATAVINGVFGAGGIDAATSILTVMQGIKMGGLTIEPNTVCGTFATVKGEGEHCGPWIQFTIAAACVPSASAE